MRLVLAIAALAATAVLAACGGVTLDPVAQAATSSSGQSFRFVADLGGAGTVRGAYDAGHGLTRVSVPLGNEPTDVVLDTSDGLVAYVHSPLATLLLPPGKDWLKVDASKQAAAAGVDLGAIAQKTPSELLAQLVHATNAQSLGRETVDGVETTHFRTGEFDVWIGDDGLVRRLASADVTVSFSGYGDDVGVALPDPARIASLGG